MTRVSVSHLPSASLGGSGGVFFGVVFVLVALVLVVDVFASMMLVAVALVYVVDMARIVTMMLMVVAFVNVVNVFACVVFVFVALVRVVGCSNHSDTSRVIDTEPDGVSLYQKLWFVNPISYDSLYN